MITKNKTIGILAATLTAGSMSASGAVVVAGWDSWNSSTAPSATVTAAGITATAAGSAAGMTNWSAGEGGGNVGRGSSGDGTWGTFAGGGTAASLSTTLQQDNFLTTNGRVSSELTFTIMNGAALDLDLSAFHMDALRWRPNATDTYALTVVSGDITTGAVGMPGSLTNNSGASLANRDLHDQVDIDLSTLADHTLAAGESAVIRIDFTGGTGSGGGHHLFLDNVAFSGDFIPVPEPSSVLLLGLSGLALLRRRRK